MYAQFILNCLSCKSKTKYFNKNTFTILSELLHYVAVAIELSNNGLYVIVILSQYLTGLYL